MPKRSFKKEFLQETLWEDTEDTEIVSDEITGTRRWSTDHYLVFRLLADNTLWGIHYSRGATEQQDEVPFEYDGYDIECEEMVAVEKTITTYTCKKDEA